jgi:4-hydroxybenzoate polyprenyltransferase
MAFTGGILIGSLQLLMIYMLNFELTWLMLFVLAILTARRIKRSTQDSHIIFNLLSVLAFILGYYILNITSTVGIIYLLSGSLANVPVLAVMNPLIYFEFLNPLSATFFQVNNILEIVFFIIGIYYAYQYSK